jgi:hypothetical protein
METRPGREASTLIRMLQIKAGGRANYVCAGQQSEKRTGLSPQKSHSCLIAARVRKVLKLTQLLLFLVHCDTAVQMNSSPHILVTMYTTLAFT